MSSKSKYLLYLFIALIVGLILGMGVFTFYYAEGYSYLSDDPQACINCHVMQGVYDQWGHSSHKSVASCNDCHAPHDLIGKYTTKMINGWNHSYAFTTGSFKEPIMINDFNRKIVLKNCMYCHSDMVHEMTKEFESNPMSCLKCHKGMGHGL